MHKSTVYTNNFFHEKPATSAGFFVSAKSWQMPANGICQLFCHLSASKIKHLA